jgi:hypothetical protein
MPGDRSHDWVKEDEVQDEEENAYDFEEKAFQDL